MKNLLEFANLNTDIKPFPAPSSQLPAPALGSLRHPPGFPPWHGPIPPASASPLPRLREPGAREGQRIKALGPWIFCTSVSIVGGCYGYGLFMFILYG